MLNTITPPSRSHLAIADVVRNGLCTGCGLCASLASEGSVQMAISSEGYARPVAAPDCKIDMAVFADSCPGMQVAHEARDGHDPIWGPLQAVRAGHAVDPATRQQGSSGGVLSGLVAWLLEKGEISYVAQIAVSHDDPLLNTLQLSHNRAEVLRAAGSRYAPSAPLADLQTLLARGERFAFIGKPCDVAALRRYARHDARVDQLVPYMFSFMCAGVPSLHGTHALLDKLGVDRQQLVSFRYRGDGWPGMARAVEQSGRIAETDYNSSWGQVLGNYLQFRCKICADGTGEFADITCADAWYGKDGYPDFTEREGRSLVLSRTARGEALVQAAMAARVIDLDVLPVQDIAQMQPYQLKRKQMVLGRTIATRLARGQAPSYRRMGLVRASLMANPIEWLRHAWGTYRRAKGERP